MALRTFLQEMGVLYDQERGLTPYNGRSHFVDVKTFFGDRCCYCGVEFGPALSAVQDHLVPINKANLGLHALGECRPCLSGM